MKVSQLKAERWMWQQLTDTPNDPQWIDPMTGLCNSTRLAEDCAEHFDAYLDEIDWEIPDEIWDAAAEVGIQWDERMESEALDKWIDMGLPFDKKDL